MTLTPDGRPRTFVVYDDLVGDLRWFESDDGGITWEMTWDEVGHSDDEPHAEVCRRDGWCFRASGEAVEERPPGGGWRHSYGLTEDQERVLEYRNGVHSGERFTTVVVVPVDGGEHVIAAASDQGVVVLDTAGEWHTQAVGGVAPGGPDLAIWPLRMVEMVAWWVPVPAAVVIVRLSRRDRGPGRRPNRPGPVLVAALLALVLWVTGALAWQVLAAFRVAPSVVASVTAVFWTLAVVVPLLWLRGAPRRSSA
ncbi:hypothetical protein [Actinomarinicola tropica]|uniref:Uncharacterized protein n=1 Tax=Actinomarinicola tropica TaxID=2789776 RepID=A0A5Q2RBY1_9ACTN|nr:hypothetical protein [Actinomarinicola tropica]QGG94389.1 hypothetical protein GH723_04320 [Actinomarinicola tropica]